MANLADMFKKEADQAVQQDTGGIALWKVVFKTNKETHKSRIRFLTEFDGGFALKWHKSKNKEYGEWGIDVPCWKDSRFGYDECPFCDDSDRATSNNKPLYVWSVWDYEESMVRLYVGRNNPKTLAGKLWDFYEENGTIVGRDFTVKLNGMDYSLQAALKETPFAFQGKVKLPTEEALVKSLILAKNRDMATELGYKPSDSIVPATERKEETEETEDAKPAAKRVPGSAKKGAAPNKPVAKPKPQEDDVSDDITFEDED